jgi:hypothetical protein
LDEDERKRRKSLANIKLFKRLIGAYILLFGGITLTSGRLAYLLMWKYAIPVTYPWDFVVPQLGFMGLILALYGGYKIVREERAREP